LTATIDDNEEVERALSGDSKQHLKQAPYQVTVFEASNPLIYGGKRQLNRPNYRKSVRDEDIRLSGCLCEVQVPFSPEAD
jgi:hypothetical protein